MAPTIELIRAQPGLVRIVYVHPKYRSGANTDSTALSGAAPAAASVAALAAVTGTSSAATSPAAPAAASVSAPSAASVATPSAVNIAAPSATSDAAPAAASGAASIYDICRSYGIQCEVNQKIFNIAAEKDNIFIIGVFTKSESPLNPRLPHAVFVNPADAGNLGANIRTCAGFEFNDIAIIRPGADAYAPKTVRASMGAVFRVRVAGFNSFDEYVAAFPEHAIYCFMLKGETELNGISHAADERFSLVFGNEATGLPDDYLRSGVGVRIAHSDAVDSLNLSVAVGIAANAFYNIRRRNAKEIDK